MLDEGHHLCLEALGVHVLHRGHAQGDAHVALALQQRVRPPVPGTGVRVTLTHLSYSLGAALDTLLHSK